MTILLPNDFQPKTFYQNSEKILILNSLSLLLLLLSLLLLLLLVLLLLLSLLLLPFLKVNNSGELIGVEA